MARAHAAELRVALDWVIELLCFRPLHGETHMLVDFDGICWDYFFDEAIHELAVDGGERLHLGFMWPVVSDKAPNSFQCIPGLSMEIVTQWPSRPTHCFHLGSSVTRLSRSSSCGPGVIHRDSRGMWLYSDFVPLVRAAALQPSSRRNKTGNICSMISIK